MARNKVFDYIQKQSCRDKHYHNYSFNFVSQQDDALLPVKCKQLMDEATLQLSQRQREVYHLKFVKGFDKKKIAKVLNITEHTAMHHAKHGMAVMRKYVLGRLEMRA